MTISSQGDNIFLLIILNYKMKFIRLLGEKLKKWNRQKIYPKIESHPKIAKASLAKKIEWKARKIVLFKIILDEKI